MTYRVNTNKTFFVCVCFDVYVFFLFNFFCDMKHSVKLQSILNVCILSYMNITVRTSNKSRNNDEILVENYAFCTTVKIIFTFKTNLSPY